MPQPHGVTLVLHDPDGYQGWLALHYARPEGLSAGQEAIFQAARRKFRCPDFTVSDFNQFLELGALGVRTEEQQRVFEELMARQTLFYAPPAPRVYAKKGSGKSVFSGGSFVLTRGSWHRLLPRCVNNSYRVHLPRASTGRRVPRRSVRRSSCRSHGPPGRKPPETPHPGLRARPRRRG